MAKMSDKTKRAINAGRRRAGLKPIKFGAKKDRKVLLKSQTTKAKRELTKASSKGYYPSIIGYQVCSKCLKSKVGSRNAWFQDFTGQKRICNACIDKMRKAKTGKKKWADKFSASGKEF